jgi:hypothetical protein
MRSQTGCRSYVASHKDLEESSVPLKEVSNKCSIPGTSKLRSQTRCLFLLSSLASKVLKQDEIPKRGFKRRLNPGPGNLRSQSRSLSLSLTSLNVLRSPRRRQDPPKEVINEGSIQVLESEISDEVSVSPASLSLRKACRRALAAASPHLLLLLLLCRL